MFVIKDGIELYIAKELFFVNILFCAILKILFKIFSKVQKVE